MTIVEYLDYAASTPIDPRVLDAMIDAYKNLPGNAGSRTHEYGEACRQAVETARRQVAHLLAVDPSDVVFTSGATESDNLAIKGLYDTLASRGDTHYVTTSIEHKAVLNCVKHLELKGCSATYVKPRENGRVAASDFIGALNDNTGFASIMCVNNETGVIQPVDEIVTSIRSRKKTIYVHVDGAQGCGKLVDYLKGIDYDLLSISGHKLYGPQGIGALIVRKRDYKKPPVSPIVFGGGQEKGLRSGTLAVPLIVGLGKAAEICEDEHENDMNDAKRIETMMLGILEASGIKYAVNGDMEHKIPSILNISIPGVSSEALMIAGKRYCAVSNGSACNSNSYEPSYVLVEMGLNESLTESAIRLSWGRGTNVENLKRQFSQFVKIAKELQQ